MGMNGKPHKIYQSYPLIKSNNIIKKAIYVSADEIEDKISNICNKHKVTLHSVNNVKLKELSNKVISLLKDNINRHETNRAQVDIFSQLGRRKGRY